METCREGVGPTVGGTSMGMKYPGNYPLVLVTKTNMVKLLESNLAEKALGVLLYTNLNRSQQGAVSQ